MCELPLLGAKKMIDKQEQQEYWNNVDGEIEFNKLRILSLVELEMPILPKKVVPEKKWTKRSERVQKKVDMDELHDEYFNWLCSTKDVKDLPPNADYGFEWWATKYRKM